MKPKFALSVSVPCALLALLLAFGCTTSQQTVAYQTLGALETSAQTAYSGYCIAVIQGITPTNDVPRVSAAFRQLQADIRLAAVVASNGTNALAPVNLITEYSDLTNVINTAKQLK